MEETVPGYVPIRDLSKYDSRAAQEEVFILAHSERPQRSNDLWPRRKASYLD
jgi:hypothetical protein